MDKHEIEVQCWEYTDKWFRVFRLRSARDLVGKSECASKAAAYEDQPVVCRNKLNDNFAIPANAKTIFVRISNHPKRGYFEAKLDWDGMGFDNRFYTLYPEASELIHTIVEYNKQFWFHIQYEE